MEGDQSKNRPGNKKKKKDFYEYFKAKAITNVDPSLYYRAVKGLQDKQKKEEFNVMSLRPGRTTEEVREELADFFSEISARFPPVHEIRVAQPDPNFVPVTSAQVEARLKECKKRRSMAEGDLFPDMLNGLAGPLSQPLSIVYNSCLEHHVWPSDWKRETVTAIPKTSDPDDFNGLRNISCTPLFSKVFEHFVLKQIQEEVSPKRNQFGGIKGTGTSHYLLET